MKKISKILFSCLQLFLLNQAIITTQQSVAEDIENINFEYFHLWSDPLPKVKCETSNCYKKIRESLEGKQSSVKLTKILNNVNTPPHQYQNGTQIALTGKRSAATVIAIHGLYGNSTQFFNGSLRFLHAGFNVILLTLPGHGTDIQNHKDLRYQDWMKAVEDAAHLGLQLGEKLIFYGQSTGGLLSAWYTAKHPNDVLLQYLIEPAFKVKSHLALSTCLGKHVISSAQQIDVLAKLFTGSSIKALKQPISLNMGCEVHRMAKKVFPQIECKYKKIEGVTGSEYIFDGYEIGSGSIFEKLQTPTIIAYSQNDSVVDSRVTEAFRNFEAISLINISKDTHGNKVQHGSYVQESQEGLLPETTYDMAVSGSEGNQKKDRFFSELEKIDGLLPYIKNNFNYYAAKILYNNVLKAQNREKKNLFYFSEHLNKKRSIWYKDTFPSLFIFNRLPLKVVFHTCALFNPDNTSCNIKPIFQDFIEKALSTDELNKFKATTKFYLFYLHIGSKVLDSSHCPDYLCDKKSLPIIVDAAKLFIDEALIKLSKYPGFQDWMNNVLESNELISFAKIPRFLPPEKFNTNELDFLDNDNIFKEYK